MDHQVSRKSIILVHFAVVRRLSCSSFFSSLTDTREWHTATSASSSSLSPTSFSSSSSSSSSASFLALRLPGRSHFSAVSPFGLMVFVVGGKTSSQKALDEVLMIQAGKRRRSRMMMMMMMMMLMMMIRMGMRRRRRDLKPCVCWSSSSFCAEKAERESANWHSQWPNSDKSSSPPSFFLFFVSLSSTQDLPCPSNGGLWGVCLSSFLPFLHFLSFPSFSL